MSTITLIIIILIVLHLVAGFGWLIYKLSPRKEDENQNGNSEEE